MDIYTDGACSPNPGFGGYAAVIVRDGYVIKKIQGYKESSTNNEMELKAVVEALKYINSLDIKEQINIFSDSLYVVNSINNNWKRNKNIELWLEIDKYSKPLSINWSHIKGHSTNLYNNLCDRLAVEARLNKVGDKC